MLLTDLPLAYALRTPSRRPDTAEMPLVMVMHGRGADANDLADIAQALDGPVGYRFVFPNAPKPFEAYPGMTFGYTWFDGWPPSAESIAASRRLLFDFLAQVTRRYPTPPGKIILSGFSQGALMALDVGLRTEMKIAGIVAMSGGLYEEGLPDLTGKRNLPILIVHGTADDMIPLPAARRARQVLERYGLQPEYAEFPMGHHVTPESMAVVADFLRRQLG
ncbi:MAG TPA: alpha/beta hydrolase [Thermoanaerobaculia bacterium]|nr:alpha/beta hydrolase [Thermoanaerobaculia bacterium]